jgi:hypothetical protein
MSRRWSGRRGLKSGVKVGTNSWASATSPNRKLHRGVGRARSRTVYLFKGQRALSLRNDFNRQWPEIPPHRNAVATNWLKKGPQQHFSLVNESPPPCPSTGGGIARATLSKGGRPFKGSATFRSAMISIGSGPKPRASQRCRNKRL